MHSAHGLQSDVPAQTWRTQTLKISTADPRSVAHRTSAGGTTPSSCRNPHACLDKRSATLQRLDGLGMMSWMGHSLVHPISKHHQKPPDTSMSLQDCFKSCHHLLMLPRHSEVFQVPSSAVPLQPLSLVPPTDSSAADAASGRPRTSYPFLSGTQGDP